MICFGVGEAICVGAFALPNREEEAAAARFLHFVTVI
jgi:hypothetical protein